MRPLLLLSLGFLAACSGGYMADKIGPREGIIAPQLSRYGLDAAQTQCVGGHLAARLTAQQLRRFEQAARSVQKGYFRADQLTLRDLSYVATQVDATVATEFDTALETCGAARTTAPPETSAPGAAAGAPPSWLNLGKAPTGQGISVDASSIERADPVRKGWFRLTDPGSAPSDAAFLLSIDCTAKTINALARRKQDAAGAVTEYREYSDSPGPIESGTVMEIAYLSLCT